MIIIKAIITETLAKEINLKENITKKDAYELINYMYLNEKIILSYDNFKNYKIEIIDN